VECAAGLVVIVCTYVWKHLPNGGSGRSEKVFEDMAHFERVLASWNSQQPKTWAYEKALDSPVRRASKVEVDSVYPEQCY
jgi:hypothetical protein